MNLFTLLFLLVFVCIVLMIVGPLLLELFAFLSTIFISIIMFIGDLFTGKKKK